jgi:hypothetical protein
MALPLPDLGDRAFDDLMAEARSLIVGYDPAWTNHNVSDPGVTLVELFAWLSEMLIYRADRVPDRHLRTFLRLLNGPDWRPGTSLAEDIRSTVLAVRRVERTVTCYDYEHLARAAAPGVARAHCVPQRNLSAGTEAARAATFPGHVSVIVLPEVGAQPDAALLGQVRDYLEPRRVVATRNHVVGPVYAPVAAEILIARRSDVPETGLRGDVVSALTDYLDPRTGGPAGAGWPFGRDIFVSELYQLLEGLAGVDHVPDIAVQSRCPEEAPRCVEATVEWTDAGEQIGLRLESHHLPQARVDPAHVVVGTAFVPVRIAVTVDLPGKGLDGAVRRAAVLTVREMFHPLHQGPDGSADQVIGMPQIRTNVGAALGVSSAAVTVGVSTDAEHLLRDETGEPTGVGIQAGELADLQEVTVYDQ